MRFDIGKVMVEISRMQSIQNKYSIKFSNMLVLQKKLVPARLCEHADRGPEVGSRNLGQLFGYLSSTLLSPSTRS